MALWGVPYNQWIDEENTRAHFIDDSAWCVGSTRKWTAATIQPLSETSLKDSGEGKSSKGDRTPSSTLSCSLCLEEKMASCAVLY